MTEGVFVKTYNWIDSLLKFPNLRKGEIGIQVGFDLSSKNLSTDVIKMSTRTKKSGQVIAVDPDPVNHERLAPIIEERGLSVKLIQMATYSKQTTDKLILGTRASYNTIGKVQGEVSSNFTDEQIEVELDTLDNIVEKLNLDYSKIRHINITNNGAEYDTLLGMANIFEKCPNINLTILSGRRTSMGVINGQKDYEVVMQLLSEKGFTCKFLRANHSLWWGVISTLIIRRIWIFNKAHSGIVMASKGNRRIKFYQSFS